MIINFRCKCGNTDPNKSKHYEGSLGYGAVVCKTCGRYSDHTGSFEADNWSKEFVGIAKTK